MAELEELIRGGGIEFYEKKKKLDSNINDFGEYNWDLARHLAVQPDVCMTVKGKKLAAYLSNVKRLFVFTSFLYSCQVEKEIMIHAEVDLEKVNSNYCGQRAGEDWICNLAGKKIYQFTHWGESLGMSIFERDWNLALCNAAADEVGTGYEWPRNDSAFGMVCLENAIDFLIGTKKQLSRYESYLKKYPKPDLYEKIKATISAFR